MRELQSEAQPANTEEAAPQLELASRLGQCAAWTGRFDEAEPMLLSALDQLTLLQAKAKTTRSVVALPDRGGVRQKVGAL